MHYILNGHEPKEATLLEWSAILNKPKLRQVDLTKINNNVEISTVFVGIEMEPPKPGGLPILFETMIFGGVNDEFTERYSTWEEAKKGHKKAVDLCKL